MYCSPLRYWKLKLYKQALSKIRAVKYNVSFFSRIYLSLFSRGFVKILWKNCSFLLQIFHIYYNTEFRRSTYNVKFENNRFFIGLLAEGTTNTWWILLYNDRKSRHQGSKSNVAMNAWLPHEPFIPVGGRGWSSWAGRVGPMTHLNKTGWVIIPVVTFLTLLA